VLDALRTVVIINMWARSLRNFILRHCAGHLIHYGLLHKWVNVCKVGMWERFEGYV
jgi:hypothetical protein